MPNDSETKLFLLQQFKSHSYFDDTMTGWDLKTTNNGFTEFHEHFIEADCIYHIKNKDSNSKMAGTSEFAHDTLNMIGIKFILE